MDRLRSLLRRAGRGSLAAVAFVGLVVLGGAGSAGRAHAESVVSPLAEMRAAAEALADVEPDSVRPPRRDTTPSGRPAAPATAAAATKELTGDGAAATRASARAVLQKEIRSAVQAEITREAQGLGRGQTGAVGQGAVRRGQADTEHERGRSEAAHAGEAATQAQQARLNRAVGLERAKNQGKGPGQSPSQSPSQMGKPLLLPSPTSAASGRPQIGR